MIAIERKVKTDATGKVELQVGSQFQNRELRVIILIGEGEAEDKEWNSYVSNNPALNFLNEEEELYTKKDGTPYKRDQQP
jgi:hypothetical protein